MNHPPTPLQRFGTVAAPSWEAPNPVRRRYLAAWLAKHQASSERMHRRLTLLACIVPPLTVLIVSALVAAVYLWLR